MIIGKVEPTLKPLVAAVAVWRMLDRMGNDSDELTIDILADRVVISASPMLMRTQGVVNQIPVFLEEISKVLNGGFLVEADAQTGKITISHREY